MMAWGSTGQVTASGPSEAGRLFCPPTLRLCNLKPGIFGLRAGERFTAGRGCFLWNLSSGRVVLQFKADNFDYANCGDLSPDGRFVATGSGGQDEPGAPHK